MRNGKDTIVDITTGKPPERKAKGPKCPHCGFQPALVYAVQTQFGRMVSAVFSCQACDAILSVAPVAMAEPETPRIVVPGQGV